MACNCVTSQQLDQLYRAFGQKRKTDENLTLMQKVKSTFMRIGLYLMMLVIIPILIIYVVYVSYFGDGKISLTKFFNLKGRSIEEYVKQQREQQDIQDKD